MEQLIVNNFTLQELKDVLDTSPSAFISISYGVINILIGMLIAILLKYTYDKYESVSQFNRSLSNNFIPLTLITVFIISVVKSSLALSLGLVGALSIVRFRTAIKDPTELIYLFFCIAIGLGLGANLAFYTVSISAIILLVIILRKIFFNKDKLIVNNMFLEIEINDNQNNLSIMMKELTKYTSFVSLVRHDYENGKNLVSLKATFESTYFIDQFKSSEWFKGNVKSFSLYESTGLI
tara:strand:+ start:4576 stop:5286 length:711 start_codon:yes stop_codon:yes gene_type:complete